MVQEFPERVVLLAVFFTRYGRIDASVRHFGFVDLVGQVRLVWVHHLGRRPTGHVRALLVPGGRDSLQGVVVVPTQVVLVAAHVVGLLVLAVVHVFQLAAVCSGEGAATVVGLFATVMPVVPEDAAGDHEHHHQGDEQDQKGNVVFPLCGDEKDKNLEQTFYLVWMHIKRRHM